MKLRPHRWFALASFLALTLRGQAAPDTTAAAPPANTDSRPAAGGPLTNEDVVKLVKPDLGDEVVIAMICKTPAVAFKLETDDLVKLKEQGVSKEVIAAMLRRAPVQTGARY